MKNIGMDLGRPYSVVCQMGSRGPEWKRIRTDGASLREYFSRRDRCRVLLEASTESEWVARLIEGLGHEAVVADPNFAPMYAERSRRIKTDSRDAHALMRACELGAYRLAHRTTDEQRHVRSMLGARDALIRTRTRWISVIRATLRREGFRVKSGETSSFSTRVKELDLPAHLTREVEPLLIVLKPLNEQLAELDRWISQLAARDPRVKRLCTVPGIGPITATAFVATLDDAGRFRNAHQLESYLGLVPREWSSSEVQRRGSITKTGSKRMRWLLVEAAWSVLRSRRPEVTELKTWADRIALRRGKPIAAVALARRLAGILYAMWRDERPFDPQYLGVKKAA